MVKVNTLFLVDDDEIFQYLTSEVISSTELVDELKVFSNGAEAIEYIEQVKDVPSKLPDVIFLDLFMPVMDGWGFLERFTSIKPVIDKSIIIYVLSSSIDPADIQRAKLLSEVSEFIVKPLTRDKFISTMQEIVIE